MNRISNPGDPLGGSTRRHATLAPVLLTAAVMVAFAASRLAIADVASEREYDEGVYLLSARSLLAGNALFSSVFSSQPPAFLESLVLAMRVMGDTLATGRVLILGFALIALAAIADLGRRIAGPWAAPAAAAALALVATFVDLAHVVSAETPALAFAMVSLCACLHARRRGWHRGWLLATGALLALACLFKLLVAPLAAPLGLLLLLAPEARDDDASWTFDTRWKQVLERSGLVAAGALAVGCLPLLFYDHRAMFEQTITFHLDKQEAYRLNRIANLTRSGQHLLDNAAIGVTAVAGAALLFVRNRGASLWLLGWFVLALLVLMQQTPLFWRHFALLSPPLALAASVAVAFVAERFSWKAASAVALAAMVAWHAPALFDRTHDAAMFPLFSRAQPTSAALRRTADWIRDHTQPGELVAGDDPMAMYLAGRQAPGALVDTSQARIVSHSLSLREAARESTKARVIVLRKGGRLSYLAGYQGWLMHHYDLDRSATAALGAQRFVWIRKPQEAASVPHR